MKQAAKKKRTTPYRLALQQFKRFYGASYYYGGVRPGLWRRSIWPTRDGVIPWKRFWLDYADMWNVLALERINLMDAMLVTAVVLHAKKDNYEATQLLDNQLNEAYPQH